MRRILLAVVAIVLVNLPWANDAWVQHRIDASGVEVQATVVKDAQKRGDDFLSYRLPKSIDPQQTLYGVQVSAGAYQAAVSSGHIEARVVPGNPNENRLAGQVTGSIVIVIAVIGDAIILLLLGFVVLRRRRWSRFVITGVEDDVLSLLTHGETLTARLADDPTTAAAISPSIGARVRGVLYLVPDDDVVSGPPIGEIARLQGPRYRIAGRVRALGPTYTDVQLENGYVLRVISDEVAHEAELRGPAAVTGTLTLAARPPV